MQITRTTLRLLQFGTLQTLLMALYHFLLPYQFQWASAMPTGAPTLRWALFALNHYFSFTLLLLTIPLLTTLFKKRTTPRPLSTILLTLFWAFSGTYQLIEPMTLPTSLLWLSYLLAGLAWTNALILAWGARRLVREINRHQAITGQHTTLIVG
ncbi:MAG TPA: hypothetical protein DCR93_29140 [Cytophagales bacterium]|nr:hypothetical protein [Cytophagales bacterium]HAP63392.1 hypothetical protein [Cytophagales bacterium]